MTRRLAAALLSLATAVALTACGVRGNVDSPSQEAQEQQVPGGDGPEGTRDPEAAEGEENEQDGVAPIGEGEGGEDQGGDTSGD